MSRPRRVEPAPVNIDSIWVRRASRTHARGGSTAVTKNDVCSSTPGRIYAQS